MSFANQDASSRNKDAFIETANDGVARKVKIVDPEGFILREHFEMAFVVHHTFFAYLNDYRHF